MAATLAEVLGFTVSFLGFRVLVIFTERARERERERERERDAEMAASVAERMY